MSVTGFRIHTSQGKLLLKLRPDAAPQTVAYIVALVGKGLYNRGAATFYRSDFVIQCGLHPKQCPLPNIPVNETHLHTKLTNKRGTAAIAHFDVPDCGNSEFFINLQHNSHLDSAYGGYCVFAEADEGDQETDIAINSIAAVVKHSGSVPISEIELVYC